MSKQKTRNTNTVAEICSFVAWQGHELFQKLNECVVYYIENISLGPVSTSCQLISFHHHSSWLKKGLDSIDRVPSFSAYTLLERKFVAILFIFDMENKN